ncbi:MAG: SWIM zinc finger family protein, partial [Acidimicrobiia bacterium]
MSRPRKPYGPNPPGRLPATMVKVLAAELSDQGRLSRGKRYWADDAVIDIVIGHGSVTGEVQGSRHDPYVVTIEAEGGTGVPAKREIWIRCTCPDDSGFGNEACKHAVAVLFALSDEVAIDPSVLDRWRSGRRRSNVTDLPDRGSVDDTAERERPADVIPLRRPGSRAESPASREPEPVRDPQLDEIARLLAAPGGALPDVPTLERVEHPALPDPLASEVLADAPPICGSSGSDRPTHPWWNSRRVLLGFRRSQRDEALPPSSSGLGHHP